MPVIDENTTQVQCIKTLRQYIQKHKRIQKKIAAISVVAWVLLIPLYMFHACGDWYMFDFIILVSSQCLFLVGDYRSRNECQKLMRTVASSQSQFKVGVIVETLWFEGVSLLAKELISRILTETERNDVKNIDLSPYQQKLLWNDMFISWFKKGRGDEKTALLVFHIIVAIGNNEMLKEVESVARTNSPGWRCKHIVRVAKACASNMKIRLAQQNVPETLLRPSLLSTSPDLLLRPVTSSTQANPAESAQLLRPDTVNDSEHMKQTTVFHANPFVLHPVLPLVEQTIPQANEQTLYLEQKQEQSHSE